jgi:hypothetical protein
MDGGGCSQRTDGAGKSGVSRCLKAVGPAHIARHEAVA